MANQSLSDQRLSPLVEINRKKRAKMSSKNRPLVASVIRKKRGNVVSTLLNEMGQLGKLLLYKAQTPNTASPGIELTT